MNAIYTIPLIGLVLFLLGIRVVSLESRGLIETLGHYTRIATPGFHWIIPVVQKLYRVSVIEQMIHVEPQVIIANDQVSAAIETQGYFKIKPDE